ncbi:hypothetical protein GMORB2_7546 [Geosmithia morbida]|uniref:Small secreted protein n=1 Tax=Geosmithia morbida TaxID=1094350 RepID=A0A9P5D5J4_9HYPO|nr:uncharacterized protein GMORB2_7546 [Geosmithia morbida]KAF4122554.1 hypothetical protein GMORB2_7546 [Geosmithia morbida]
MYFSKTLVLSFAVSALALPTALQGKAQKRAGVLSASDYANYADFQISDGVAGNALDEVNEKFPIDTSDLANVDDADLEIIKTARETAEAAETDAGGFNEAIDAAGEDTEEGEALQVGKIKNKVLKLQLEVLALQIEQAKGEDNAEKLEEEQTKLNKNIATDQESAGETSQSVNFTGTGSD